MTKIAPYRAIFHIKYSKNSSKLKYFSDIVDELFDVCSFKQLVYAGEYILFAYALF